MAEDTSRPDERSKSVRHNQSHPSIAVSAAEAARLLGVGRTSIFEAIRLGQLQRLKFGRRTLILRADLDAFVGSLKQSGAK